MRMAILATLCWLLYPRGSSKPHSLAHMCWMASHQVMIGQELNHYRICQGSSTQRKATSSQLTTSKSPLSLSMMLVLLDLPRLVHKELRNCSGTLLSQGGKLHCMIWRVYRWTWRIYMHVMLPVNCWSSLRGANLCCLMTSKSNSTRLCSACNNGTTTTKSTQLAQHATPLRCYSFTRACCTTTTTPNHA